jgi:TPR repeat protein
LAEEAVSLKNPDALWAMGACRNIYEPIFAGSGHAALALGDELLAQYPGQAFQWFIWAARTGLVSASRQVSNCLSGGVGIEKNAEAALRWGYGSSHSDVLDNARKMFEAGQEEEALLLLRRGAEGGATKPMAMFGIQLILSNREADWAQGYKWIKRSYDAGDQLSIYGLMLCNVVRGLGEQEPEEAFDVLLELAEKGNMEAMIYVGKMYGDGLGVERDIRQARLWLYRAIKMGSVDARMILSEVEARVPKQRPARPARDPKSLIL